MTEVIYVPLASGGYAVYALVGVAPGVAVVASAPTVSEASTSKPIGFKGSHVAAVGGGTPHTVGFKVG